MLSQSCYYFLENYPNDTSIGNIWNRLINCNSETADVRNNKLKEILERDINKFKTEELVQLKSFLKSDNNTKSKDSNAVAHNNQEPIREQSTKSEPNNDVQTKPEPNKEVLTKVDQTKEEPMTNSITKVESRPQKQITSQERIKNFNDSIIHLIHHAQPELINKNNPNDTIIGIGFIDLENTKMTLTYKFLEFFEKYPIYLDGKQLKFKIQNNSIKTLLFFKGKVNHNKIYVSGSSDLFYTVSDLKIWYKGQLQKEHFMDSFTVSPNKSETDYMTNHNMDQFPTYDGGMLYLDKTLANLKTYICSIIKANCPAAVLKIKSEYEEREKGDIKELTNLLPSSCESTLPKLPSTVHPFTNLNNNVSRKDSKANAFLTFNNHLFAIGSTRSGQKVRYNFNKYFDDEYVGVQSKEFKKLESDDVPFNFRDVMNKFAIPKIKKPGSAELYLLFAEDLLLVGDTEAAEVAYYSTLNIAGRLQTSIPNKCIIKQAAYRGLAEIAEKKNRPLTAELFRLAETLIEDYLSSPNADIDNNAFFSPLEDLQSKCYDVQIEIQRLKAQRTANLINGIAGAAMSVTAAAAGDQSSFEIISNQTLNSLKDGWQQIGFIQQEIQAQDNFFKDVPLTTMEESALLNDLEFNKTFIDVEVGYFCAKYKDSGFPFDIFHNFFKDKIQLKNMVYDANGKIIITTDDQITSLMSQISKLEATARKLEGRGIQINKKAL